MLMANPGMLNSNKMSQEGDKVVFFFIKIIAKYVDVSFLQRNWFHWLFFLIEVTMVYNTIEVLGAPQYNSTSVYTIRHYVQGNI